MLAFVQGSHFLGVPFSPGMSPPGFSAGPRGDQIPL
jgi:hypothetical protein